MKIIIFEIQPQQQSLFSALERDHEVIYTAEPLTRQNVALYTKADIISTLNESDLSEGILRQFKRLRQIATRTTGTDHIPEAYCQEEDILIHNVPHYGQHTVAEHAFALLLSLSHRLKQELQRPLQGDFCPKGMVGFDLYGKTMGVIGVGNIGKNLVRIAQGFNMKVLGYDIAPDFAWAAHSPCQFVSLDTLLAESDFVSLHVPGDASTYHLLSTLELQRMKPGAVLMNTARGTVVDILALAEALQLGHLGGACLDVLPYESVLRNPAQTQRLRNHPDELGKSLRAIEMLLKHPNVVVSPHIAYNTVEAHERILRKTVENIQGFLG